MRPVVRMTEIILYIENEDCRLNYKTKTRCKCWLSCSPLLGCACFALVLQAGKTVSCHIITFSPPRTRSKPLFSNLNILSLHSLHKFHVFCFVFSHFNLLLPASLSLERVRGGEKVMIWYDTVFPAWRTSAKHAHPCNWEQLNKLNFFRRRFLVVCRVIPNWKDWLVHARACISL